MAMTANSIFFFQKILRCLGRGMRSVKRRDSQFPALKPAAVPQGMIDFIIGKNKRGGLSMLRARGSNALENSVKVSRDRNLVAAVFLIPAVLLIYRYRLYDPGFLQGLDPNSRLLVVAGVFGGYLLLRFLLYLWARPRRRYDDYQMAYRAGYTFFILLMMLSLVTVGILWLLHSSDLTVKTFLLVEAAVVYFLYLIRRGQILSTSCKPLTTFLYLCGLELLPTAALVLTAVIL